MSNGIKEEDKGIEERRRVKEEDNGIEIENSGIEEEKNSTTEKEIEQEEQEDWIVWLEDGDLPEGKWYEPKDTKYINQTQDVLGDDSVKMKGNFHTSYLGSTASKLAVCMGDNMRENERENDTKMQEVSRSRGKKDKNSLGETLTQERERVGNKESIIGIALFPAIFIYLEVVFHLFVFKKIDGNIWYSIFAAIAFGLVIGAITSVFRRRINCIIGMTAISIVSVWFCVQLVFQHIFRTFLSLYSVGENGGDVLEFWKEAVSGILDKLVGIFILLLPILVAAVVIKKFKLLKKQSLYMTGFSAGGAVLVYILFMITLLIPGKDAYTPYDLYHKDFVPDLGIEKLGVLTATRFDIQSVVFGVDDFKIEEDAFLAVDPIIVTPTTVPVTKTPDTVATPTLAPTEVPIDTSPNVIDIDFAALAEKEEDEAVSSLYQYFENVTPTNKNEYTGMFKGYNLIFLTAEGFSPWAVDEKVTPTLYKLTHSGFVFENFYTPIWWTSTSDGEYVACTGLIPSGSNSFTKSAKGDMPLCLGWQFQELGYTVKAYHDHSYSYYNRDLTHPNMGYDYKGTNGGGLELKKTWPESDLEMMQVTLPEYINEQPFHTYYMTVSGHMEYTFFGNYMASKNKDYVKDLPYSDDCKAYIACNKEFDLALEYLIGELKKAGVLDKTVIAFSADHYPYGLAQEEINELAGHEVDENFELYENYFVLWNAAMKEPIVIDKNCSSLDIMPTLNNLFGIEYDSRLFMGQDILSDSPALVMMSNQSFITDYVKYNSKTGESELLQDVELPENYLKGYISIVKNKFNVSGSMIKNNFYHNILPELGLKTYKKPKVK